MKTLLALLLILGLYACNRPEQYKKPEKEKVYLVIIDKCILTDNQGNPNLVFFYKDSCGHYNHESVNDSAYYNIMIGDTIGKMKKK